LIIFIDFCSSFVHHISNRRIRGFEMQTGLDLMMMMMMMFAVGGAWLAAAFAVLGYFRAKPAPQPLTAHGAALLLRAETDIVRGVVEDQAGRLRQELNQSLKGFQELTVAAVGGLRDGIEGQVRGFGERLDAGIKLIDERAAGIATKLNDDIGQMRSEANTSRETLRGVIEAKLEHSTQQQAESAKGLRDELGGNFQRLGSRVSDSLSEASRVQKERLETVTLAVSGLSEKLEKGQQSLRAAVESRLDAIRQENATKLDEMRQTVDEKLQTTLEARLGESFNRVVEHLERVHKGIGEMQTLAANVGDLKNVLTNVKVRGTYGEVQLALLLEQFLSPDQYVKNASVGTGGRERVEYAIKFPADGEQVLLPIDSKFPREDYEHLQEAIAAGDANLITQFRRELESKIKACAKEISSKYINPPHTLEFAILFVPTESLYAEILRQPGLSEQLQRDYRIMIAGPTNLAALLTSFQMGFRSLALQKRSSEVWQLLGAIKGEFDKYGDVVSSLARQLNAASNSVDSLGKRTRVMSRKLKDVEVLSDEKAAEKLLGFSTDDAVDGSFDHPAEIEKIRVVAR
jgi:DNA recombination protein RmuC